MARDLLLTTLLATGLVVSAAAPALAQDTDSQTGEAAKKAPKGSTWLGSILLQGLGGVPLAYSGGQVATGGTVGILCQKGFMGTPCSTVAYTEDYVENRGAQDVGSVSLAALRGTCTKLVIAHRPATLAMADRILRLQNEKIAEMGPPGGKGA